MRRYRMNKMMVVVALLAVIFFGQPLYANDNPDSGNTVVKADELAEGLTWRSDLYPDDWRPGFEHADSQGRFLHDFSYAGYHRGEIPIPENPSSNIIDVTKAPYNADRSGRGDATSVIQAAINAAGNAGGGIVFLPSGTYRIATPPLRIPRDNVVIRGAGQEQTRLFFDKLNTRLTSQLIMGRTDSGWTNENPGTVLPVAEDIAPESLTFKAIRPCRHPEVWAC